MAKDIVTLYIDDTSLRLMVNRGKRIKKLAELPLQFSLADIDVSIKEAEVAAKVKQLLKSQKVGAKKVIVGLSGLHCLTRPAVLPQLPRAMLAEAVTREARRLLPMPPEQLYISWQIIGVHEDKVHIFLVAIPRKIADILFRVLRQVGLKPYLMDLKPLALARVVKDSTAIIVDVQPNEFDIVIMADGIPQPVRTIPFPNEPLSPQDRLLMVRNELERTIKFFNSNNPEKPLVSDIPMFVSGELVDGPEPGEFLSNELGHPVQPLLPPLKCPQQLDPTRYLVNVGLALKVLEGEAGPLVASVNALPAPYRPKPFPLAKMVAVPSIVTVSGLMVFLAMFMQDASASIASMRSQMETASHILEQKQSQKKELTNNIARIEKQLASAEASRNTFVAALDSLDEQGNTINGDLKAVTDSLLSTVNLGSVSHSGATLNISGTAPTEAEVLAYARNLDDSGRFPKVTISSLRLVENEEEAGGEGEVVGEGESQVESMMSFTLVLEIRGES